MRTERRQGEDVQRATETARGVAGEGQTEREIALDGFAGFLAQAAARAVLREEVRDET